MPSSATILAVHVERRLDDIVMSQKSEPSSHLRSFRVAVPQQEVLVMADVQFRPQAVNRKRHRRSRALWLAHRPTRPAPAICDPQRPDARLDHVASDEEWPPGGLEQSECLFGPLRFIGNGPPVDICLGQLLAGHARVDAEYEARAVLEYPVEVQRQTSATPRDLIHNAQRTTAVETSFDSIKTDAIHVVRSQPGNRSTPLRGGGEIELACRCRGTLLEALVPGQGGGPNGLSVGRRLSTPRHQQTSP